MAEVGKGLTPLHEILAEHGITGKAAEDIIGFNHTRVEAERLWAKDHALKRPTVVNQYALDDHWNAYTEKGPWGEIEVTITSSQRIPGASITISAQAARKLVEIGNHGDPEEDPF